MKPERKVTTPLEFIWHRSAALCALLAMSLMSVSAFATELNREQQRQEIIEFLTGTFSNYQQSLQLPGAVPSPLLQSFRQVTVDGLEGPVILATHRFLLSPEQVFRRQVYHFVLPRRSDKVVQQIFELTETADLDNLQRSELAPLFGCEITWQWIEAGHYQGQRDPEQCYFFDQASERQIQMGSELMLTANALSIRDWGTWPDGSYALGDENSLAVESLRLRFYDADVQFRTNVDDDDAWQPVRLLTEVHDQGERVAMEQADSGMELSYQLELLRNFTEDEVSLRVYRGNLLEPVAEVIVPAEQSTIELEMNSLKIELQQRD